MDNFDRSSRGVDLELHVCYDTDLSQIYFNDFTSEMSVIDDIFYLHGDFDKPFFTVSKLKKFKKAELIDLAYMFELSYHAESLLKIELVELLSEVSIKEYYAQRLTWGNFVEFLEHGYYISHGYSQGDTRMVIFCNEPLNYEYKHGNSIDNIFWNAPLSISMIIDNEDFCFGEHISDQYDYDPEEIIKAVKDNVEHPKLDYIVSWVTDNLPKQP